MVFVVFLLYFTIQNCRMPKGLPLVTLPGALLQAKRSRRGGRALGRDWKPSTRLVQAEKCL